MTVDWRLDGAEAESEMDTERVSSRGGSCCCDWSTGVSSRFGGVGAGDGKPLVLCVYEDRCCGTARGELAASWVCWKACAEA